jgi:hypothetical protein
VRDYAVIALAQLRRPAAMTKFVLWGEWRFCAMPRISPAEPLIGFVGADGDRRPMTPHAIVEGIMIRIEQKRQQSGIGHVEN